MSAASSATTWRASWIVKVVIKACWDAFWALMLPVIILGGILLGICTATEAAVISAVYAFIVSVFIYRELKLKDFLPVLVNTCRGTAVVLLVCGAAMAAASFITRPKSRK